MSALEETIDALPADVDILVVDDKHEARVALSAVLAELGVNVVAAHSGREALREILRRPFALILLDINMPGLDGFETAELVREYRGSRSTPIIFMTAGGDDLLLGKSYALGAVDYILTPVVPEVLRSKVRVFVELHRKTEQMRRQAEALEEHAARLQRLADASLAINAARSLDGILEALVGSARRVLGAHQAFLTLAAGHGRMRGFASLSDKHVEHRAYRPDARVETLYRAAVRGSAPLRLSGRAIHASPELRAAAVASGEGGAPPMRGLVAVPLTDRDGRNVGLLQLSDRAEGDFTEGDLAFLVQLAQFGSIAIQNCLHADAREANRLKDEFLATLSHELRTPLHVMLGWVRLLRSGSLEGERAARGLEVIERNVNLQSGLIEGLLDVSSIMTGKLRVECHPTSLREVVACAVDALRPAAAAKGVELATSLGDDACETLGDSARLHQVVSNVVQNAVKFTPRGGTIGVSLGRDGADVEVRVADTGIGIAKEFLPFVFERFRQADSSTTRAQGGLGLGLSVALHLVELHGGTLRAESEGVGLGAMFTVRLPSHRAPLRLAAQAQLSPMSAEGPFTSGLDAAPDSGVYTLDGLHVLVVDDDDDAREMLAEVLARHRARVTTARSTREALAAMVLERPHVLVSDIAMEGEDGYDLIRSVRGRESGTVPALALTAHARHEDRRRALDAGFSMHATKPIEPHELVAAVARLARAATDGPLKA